MLFNSWEFLAFLIGAFVLFWSFFHKGTSRQNIFVILCSYIFYGWWDWRFLFLIIGSSLVDYTLGLKISSTSKPNIRKLYLGISLLANLGTLAFFKYYNFFIQSFQSAYGLIGSDLGFNSLEIILPIGISFYTFQTLSYTIDIYNGKIEPTKDWKAFFAFVGFFPQLVAGPIERASQLLPQFYRDKKFDYSFAVSGMQLILWGFVKKVVIADNCAYYVYPIFENPNAFSSVELAIGALLFAFQIYGDFSGYSDIAIGTGRLFGFHLNKNFNYPYFSTNTKDFWNRWHISLSTWFRDYIFIPLGGSKVPFSKLVLNIYITFLISGLWHGANYTFIAWGFIHATIYLTQTLLGFWNLRVPKLISWINIPITFVLICITWIFFRAGHLKLAFWYLLDLFSFRGGDLTQNYFYILILILLFHFAEFFNQNKSSPISELRLSKISRWSLYLFLTSIIFLFGRFDYQEFIYFQF